MSGRFLFNDNRTSEQQQVVNVQQRDDSGGAKRYIPLVYDERLDAADHGQQSAANRRAPMETRVVPAMTDDGPTVVDEDISKEDIR